MWRVRQEHHEFKAYLGYRLVQGQSGQLNKTSCQNKKKIIMCQKKAQCFKSLTSTWKPKHYKNNSNITQQNKNLFVRQPSHMHCF